MSRLVLSCLTHIGSGWDREMAQQELGQSRWSIARAY